MAYYDALIAAWNNGLTLPSGVTGTAFAAGDSTATKLGKVNGWTVKGPTVAVPAILVRGVLYALGKWSAVRKRAVAASLGTDTTAAGIPALNLHDLVDSGDTIDMTNPAIATAIQNDLAALVSVNDLDANAQAAVLALATPQIPWATATLAQGGAGLGVLVQPGDLVVAGLS